MNRLTFMDLSLKKELLGPLPVFRFYRENIRTRFILRQFKNHVELVDTVRMTNIKLFNNFREAIRISSRYILFISNKYRR